uniref:Contactin 2 n=1 Tax=Cyprinodon variegatus TaxID=28743 RepID=A0A3Q2DCI8_CYPVA
RFLEMFRTFCTFPSLTHSSAFLGPMFEEQPSSLIYPEGLTEGKITLSCQARANPPATYSWKLNGTLLELGSSRYTLVAGSLVISNPDSIQDTGSYQCLEGRWPLVCVTGHGEPVLGQSRVE